ncbi:uncharacterized protein LOC120158414 [Hibiscus syriacus]|uniref:uncharacterized protein LOC120158414 n=1 Tax=Hibiscus syriacus TaxID=106335 RepID=UPI001923DF33|nr:uncharacterized protein LOC120158414 [Hibiscus syriacus]
MLDALANGIFLDKLPKKAFNILDRIANNDYQFPFSRFGTRSKVIGTFELDAKDSVSPQLSAIINILKNLQRSSEVKEVKMVSSASKEVRPSPLFTQRLKKQNDDIHFKKFVNIIDQLYINVPLLEAIDQMVTYAKFLKDIVTKKRNVEMFETVVILKEYYSTLTKHPSKRKDPRSFVIPCSIVDRSHVRLEGRIKDVIVKVDKFLFPADFLILDCEDDDNVPIISGHLFLATGHILIDFEKGEFTMRVPDQSLKDYERLTEDEVFAEYEEFSSEVDHFSLLVARKDIVEDFLDIFMDYFSVSGDNFDKCLGNLAKLVYRKACHLPVELEHKAYWVINKLNMDAQLAGEKRFLELNETEEFHAQVYENASLYKEKTK